MERQSKPNIPAFDCRW